MRALLLLEEDFNGLHKINFNGRLTPSLEASSSMPQEIIGGRRSQSATHIALRKKSIADISNTRKLPTVTICADAANCYDRVSHPYASFCPQYFGIEICYILVLLKEIQSMKIHLRTAFDVSSSFYTSNVQPFQGAIQGNGASPALWLITSVFLSRCLYQQKVVTSITSPISKMSQFLAALMYVDDADLYVVNDGSICALEVVIGSQKLLNTWHESLRFTGCDLKLLKWYWMLQDYQWQN